MEDSLRDEKSDAEGRKLTYNNNRMWMQLANVALAAFSSRGNKLSENRQNDHTAMEASADQSVTLNAVKGKTPHIYNGLLFTSPRAVLLALC